MRIGLLIRLAAITFCLLPGAITQTSLVAAEYFDLRFDEALVSSNPKTRDWVRSPRIRFTMVDGKAVLPVIELKRGWVVPSWKGVVDSIAIERGSGDNIKGRIKVRINSSIGIAGTYEFSFATQQDGEDVRGTFVSQAELGDPIKGNLRGTVRKVPAPALDLDNSFWTVQLVQALPKEETLTLYLNRSDGRLTSAFAFSPNVTRRPIDVDVSKLRFTDGKLTGTISATRLNTREPDDGERTVFGRYEIEADVASSQLRGTHAGVILEEQAVEGEVWGEIRPRNALPDTPNVWLKLEDGYAGGAMWQNRVFFKAALNEHGKLVEGSAYNNKGVFEANLTAADLQLSDDRITGTLHSSVHKSGSVSLGDYSFRIKGQRAGDVLYGRFYTTYDGKEDHSGYFVGGIDRTQN